MMFVKFPIKYPRENPPPERSRRGASAFGDINCWVDEIYGVPMKASRESTLRFHQERYYLIKTVFPWSTISPTFALTT